MVPIKEYDGLTQKTIRVIREAFPGMQSVILRLGDIDPARGSGRIDDHTRCVWTKDGYRITMVQTRDGGRIGTCSKEKDPLANPEARNVSA